jgi:hypothetical protein
MKKSPSLLFLALLAPLAACVSSDPKPAAVAENKPVLVTNIGIGGGETDAKTHLAFEGIPKGAKIVQVSTRLIVDKVAPKGLNFFAIQVNYPNKTWAHGGPQFVSGGVEQANWGGLVNRGGGSKDYTEVDWTKDLQLIECGVGKPNTVPCKWNRNTEYVMTVERGARVTLPAGMNKEHKVMAPERTMWEWKFTMSPTDKSHEPFTSLIYDSADHIGSFYLWNESGYGSTNDQQHARWSVPTYRVEGGSEVLVPSGFKRF